jgi:hypothetical protein
MRDKLALPFGVALAVTLWALIRALVMLVRETFPSLS